jgi:hypothetical protein
LVAGSNPAAGANDRITKNRLGDFSSFATAATGKSRAGFEDPEFIVASLSSSEARYEGCTVHVMEETPAAPNPAFLKQFYERSIFKYN